MSESVVVTGIGMITPVGGDAATTWENLKSGRSGIGKITRFDASDYEYPIAGEVKNFNPAEHIDPKTLRRIDLSTAFAVAACKEALNDASIEINSENPKSVGIILGTGMGGAHLMIDQQRILEEKGPRRISPFLISHFLPDSATGIIAMELGVRGPNFAVTAACATGGTAIGEAAEIIARGEAEVIITGGYEAPLRPIYYAGFSAMKALASHEDPTKALRPFDANRNGFILGEGAGILILESLTHARERNAQIYAHWLGSGTANDAYDMVAADDNGQGIGEAMESALNRAHRNTDQIDYINAHGTSTPLNDRVETSAINRIFQSDAKKLMISSTKSMHGHMMGAAGAVEAAICALVCRDGIIPPTINYETPDPDCDLDYVPNESRNIKVRNVMSTSVGLGGHNSALIVGTSER